MPPRPPGAADLASTYWHLDKCLDAAEAAAFAATALLPPLLHGAGLPTFRFLAALAAESDEDWITRLRRLQPECDDVLVGLPVHLPLRPESRDPLVWSGIEAAFAALFHVSHGRRVLLTPMTLHHHGNAPAAVALALQYGLFDEATDLLSRLGVRTWSGWLGKAAETVSGGDGEEARWRAEAATTRIAVTEVTRWLDERNAPLLTDSRRGLIDVGGLVRGATHAATSMLIGSERDTARHRAAGGAALALLTEIGRRAAGEISRRGEDPYSSIAVVGEEVVRAAARLLAPQPSADRGDGG